ncbi:uncharacterized protein [Amphiura filiformis]|uniref:uncharacterized protein n=1 Tax=Amphiura filiformis TaxID=82378 RepID=UPI003B2263A5
MQKRRTHCKKLPTGVGKRWQAIPGGHGAAGSSVGAQAKVKEGRVWSLGNFGVPTGEMEEVVIPENISEIWVPTYVQGLSIPLLLDTGKSHTILTPNAYHSIPEDRRPKLESPHLILKQANGSAVNVWGKATVEVRVGNQYERVTIVVGEVTSCMLGMDFLRRTGAKLDFGQLQLQWEGCTVQCSPTPDTVFSSPPRVVAAVDTMVPAGHTSVISATISGMRGSGQLGVVEPLGRGRLPENGLLVARSVICTQNKVVPVSVMNVGNRPRRVRQGTCLAKMVPIGEAEVCRTRMMVSEPDPGDGVCVPDHLKEVTERSTADLESGDKERVTQLLVQYQDVFSTGEFDIGRTPG